MAVESAGNGGEINTNCLLLNRNYTVNRTNVISWPSIHITDSKEYKHSKADKALQVAA